MPGYCTDIYEFKTTGYQPMCTVPAVFAGHIQCPDWSMPLTKFGCVNTSILGETDCNLVGGDWHVPAAV